MDAGGENNTEIGVWTDTNWYNYPYMDFIIILFTAICVAGICCNVTVIFVFCSSRVMHKTTNLYVFNLAIADLLRLLISVPFLVQILYFNYPFSEFFCKLLNYAAPVTYIVSVYTLLLICLSRYISICKPGMLAKFQTNNRTITFCVVLWIVSMLAHIEMIMESTVIGIRMFDSPYVTEAQRTNITVAQPEPQYINICLPHNKGHQVQAWIDFAFGYWFPIVPIFYISSATLKHIYRQQMRQYLESRNQLYRLTTMFLVVGVAVSVLLLPYFVFNIVIEHILPTITRHSQIVVIHAVWMTLFTLYTANSALNPFIYNYFSREFHQAFVSLSPFSRLRRARVPGGDDSVSTEVGEDEQGRNGPVITTTPAPYDGDVLMNTY